MSLGGVGHVELTEGVFGLIGQEDEAWLLGMRKYFQVQDYSGNMKARVVIFNLTGRAPIWWEHFRQVKKINERKIVWK